MSNTWLCPVCYRENVLLEQQYVIRNCGHRYCLRCLAEHVWRQRSHRRPTCPVCRQPVHICGPASSPDCADASTLDSSAAQTAIAAQLTPEQADGRSATIDSPLLLQIGRVHFELPLAALSPGRGPGGMRGSICAVFMVDPSRVRLVSRGRCLESDEALRAAAAASARTGVGVLLLASRGPLEPPGRPAAWPLRRALQLLRAIQQWLATQMQRLGTSRIASRIATVAAALAQVLRLFAASLNPSFSNPPVQFGTRR